MSLDAGLIPRILTNMATFFHVKMPFSSVLEVPLEVITLNSQEQDVITHCS